RDKAVALGTDLVDKALRKHDTTLARADKQLLAAAKALHCVTVDEMIIQVGYGKITTQQVLEKAELAKADGAAPTEKAASMLKTLLRKVTGRTSSTGIKG